MSDLTRKPIQTAIFISIGSITLIVIVIGFTSLRLLASVLYLAAAVVVSSVAEHPPGANPANRRVLKLRHVQLVAHRRGRPVQWHGVRPSAGTGQSDYYLIVLGSGGHTKEMLMMMDDGTCAFEGMHRRYLVSSGDSTSLHQLEDYEADLGRLCEREGTDAGSYDVRVVTRARRVHQSFASTPATAAASLRDIVSKVLLDPPSTSARFPRVVLSNGPATGFLVGLAVHLLKMVGVVPRDSCYFIYIESWARISSLSLTGKLFHYSGLADAMAVQHQGVADAYGIYNAGALVLNSRREL